MPTPIFTLKRCETTFGIRGEALALPALPHTVNPEISIRSVSTTRRGEALSAPLAQVEALALPALPHPVNPEISVSTTSTTTGTADGTTNTLPVYLSKN